MVYSNELLVHGGAAAATQSTQALARVVVYFAGYSAELSAVEKAKLNRLAPRLRTADIVTITAHTTHDGSPTSTVANRLSRQRASTVAAYLRSLGVVVGVQSYVGKSQMVSATPGLNRRAEISWFVLEG